jgi:hypothetical protein
MANPALIALASAGIQAAQTAVLAVLGALVAFACVYFGLKKVLDLINGEGASNNLPTVGDATFSNIEAARMRANERLNANAGLLEDEFSYSGDRNPFPDVDAPDDLNGVRSWSPSFSNQGSNYRSEYSSNLDN